MIYMFLADGFEEVEALAPLDLLRRAGADVKTVGIGGNVICGAHGIKVYTDMLDSELTDHSAEMIILPGGMPGTLNLASSKTVSLAIECALKNNSYIAAICAAPSILGDRGLLCGKKAVCFPGFEDSMKGAEILNCGVVKDGNIITAAGMGVAFEFGLALVSCLYGKEKADELFDSTQAKRR
ncbi:MAG: DJ-1/PfpI family protein [Clostridia bacterium]|nr:DJ-1/PfpI family protein [Clostridia bacterium]